MENDVVASHRRIVVGRLDVSESASSCILALEARVFEQVVGSGTKLFGRVDVVCHLLFTLGEQ